MAKKSQQEMLVVARIHRDEMWRRLMDHAPIKAKNKRVAREVQLGTNRIDAAARRGLWESLLYTAPVVEVARVLAEVFNLPAQSMQAFLADARLGRQVREAVADAEGRASADPGGDS